MEDRGRKAPISYHMRCHICEKPLTLPVVGSSLFENKEIIYEFCPGCASKIESFIGGLVSDHVNAKFQRELDKRKADKK
jgi:hypothetical protein